MRRHWFISAVVLVLVGAATEGAIPLNSLQTFDVTPPVGDWATQSAGGAGSSIQFPAELDAAVQSNEVAAITNVLRATTSGTSFGLAQWNSTTRDLLTRPAGVAYQVLLGTIQNTSGMDLPVIVVGYDFGNPSPAPGAEDPGLNGVRAYYSLTGQPNSWSLIPEFSTDQTGSLAAILTLGAWSPGSMLYLLWADDNGGAATDSAFTIDNFIVLESLPPPPPPSVSPAATNILCGYTIRLAAIVSGFGLSFQWFKDGQLIDPEMNPTATQRVLTITNAEASDAGLYRLIVANAAGAQISAPVPVQVDCGGDPPNFIFAYNTPDDPKGIRVIVDEPLCTNESVCGGNAALFFNWIIESMPSREVRWLESIQVDGTNLQFTLAEPRAQGETFRIRPADDGSGNSAISDPYGNRMLLWQSITSVPTLLFKQGVNGYSGTQDTELRGASPGTPQGESGHVRVDLEVSGAPSQGLLQFGNLFGNGPGQIPLGSSIHSATLSLMVFDASSSTVNVHRMLEPWDESTATFDLLNAGVQADGVEADTTVDASFVPDGQSSTSPIELDVTRSVQAWAAGRVNHGWVLLPTGTDGFEFYSSESMSPPALSIIFGPHIDSCSFDITQPPGAITVNEGASFTLFPTLNVQGLCLLQFQWMKNGIDLPGATNGPSYFVAAASVCDAGTYRLRVSGLPSQSITSNPTVVTIPADIVRPALTRAVGSLNSTNITLNFSKAMNATSAVNAAHYVLDPPVAVIDAALSSNGRSVTLTTAPRTPLTPYTLRIHDVTDNRAACVGSVGNVISPNPTFVSLTGVRVDVPWDSEWLYSTNNQDATLSTPAPWYAPDFSPGAGWFAGQALFGTETSAGTVAQFPTPLVTSIPPNTNSPPDQITTYFRKQIDLPPLPSGATYALCHFIDDGAVFYLDGAEIGRLNMVNAPPIRFLDRAATSLEASVLCFPFTASAGLHTLAVEVHQAGLAGSPDMLFGVRLSAVTEAPRLSIKPPMVSWNADSSWDLLSSSNVAGPYAPVAASPFAASGIHYAPPTNPATFYRLRYNAIAK